VIQQPGSREHKRGQAHRDDPAAAHRGSRQRLKQVFAGPLADEPGNRQHHDRVRLRQRLQPPPDDHPQAPPGGQLAWLLAADRELIPLRAELGVDAKDLGDRAQVQRRNPAERERRDAVTWHGLHDS
jgi:hypothetical protein